ncbi:protein NO VEIN domain-containing protein [Cellulosimicrobium cellulans]
MTTKTRRPTGPADALQDGTFGAWVLHCNPRLYDIRGDVARGELNGSWSVPNTESYRLDLMDEGQPALLYVGGQRAATPPGLWGVGRLTGPVQRSVLLEHDTPQGWIGIERATTRESWVPLQLGMRAAPVSRTALLEDRVASRAEFLRAPQVVPAWVTASELKAITKLAGALAAPSGPVPEPQDDTGAGAALKKQVELAAVARVIEHYTAQGYGKPVSREQERGVGWDLTFRARGLPDVHVEVKGRLGATSSVRLTRSEHDAAHTEPGWVLAVVTRALASDASLRIYDPADVTRLAEPTHYTVDLASVS